MSKTLNDATLPLVQLKGSLFGDDIMKRNYVLDRGRAECKRLRTASIVGLSILILLLLGSVAAYAAVPAVVGTAATSLGSDWGNTNKIVMDGAGNVYTYDSGNNRILKIPADGSPRVSIPAWGGSMGLTVDASGNLYYCTLWGANVKQILYLGGGVYAAPTDWLSIYDATGSYWFPTSDITYVSSDATNDYFVIASFTTEIYQVARNKTSGKFSGALTGKVENAYNGNTVATDSKGNVFALDANSLWEIPAGTSSVNKIVTGFNKAVGISVDGADNVLVSDGNANAVILIPNENGTLNPAKKFTLYSGTVIASALLDKSGRLLVPGWGSVDAVSFSGGGTPAKAVGQASDPLTITYLFTADVTPTFSFVSQGVATTEFSDSGTGTCVSNTAYTAGQTCTLNVTTTAAAAGSRSGAVLLSNSGKVVSQFYVSGVGLGGGLLVDPGTQSSVADVSNFKTPQAVALDGVGNLYVADTGNSEVLMLPAGGGTPESVGSGLKNPAGVAVDGAGNVFISNTVTVDKTDVGQVILVPNEGGKLNTSNQVVIFSGLAANPSGLAVDRFGSVFVADTGNKRVLKLTKNFMGSYVASVVGSGYKDPVSVTTDASGNVFVGDGTEGVVYGIRAVDGAQYFVVTGLGFAGGLATDASGSIYVADSVNKVVSRIPLQSGVFFPNGVTWIGSGFVTPKAVAIDAAGNAYIADAGAPGAFQVLRGKGLIDFGQFNIGIQSDTFISKLYNYGTQPLTVSPFADLTGDFNTTQKDELGVVCLNAAIDPGKSCTLKSYFTPQAPGARTATLTITSDGGSIQQTYKGEGVALAGSTITIAKTAPSGDPLFGSPVTFSATVAATSGIPTGKVVFAIDGTMQAPVTLASGKATFTTAAMTGGKHNVTATYTGDASFASSVTAPPVLEVNVQPAVASVAVYATSTTYGVRNTYNIKDTATVTATVTAPIKTIPTGTIEFFAGDKSLGIGVVSSGVARVSIDKDTLALGTYQLTAVYNADNSDTNFAKATSPAVSLVVTPDPTFNLTSDVASTTVRPGQTGVYHITLTPLYNFQDTVVLNPDVEGVRLNCQGLLPQTACLFTLTGNGSSSQSMGTATASYQNGAFPSITLQLTTIGPGTGSPTPIAMTKSQSGVFLAMMVPGFLGIFSLAGARKNRTCKILGIALVLVTFAFLMAGCSASHADLPAKVAPSTGTPAGTTTVTVVATSTSSGSVSPSVTQTMQFKFTVVN